MERTEKIETTIQNGDGPVAMDTTNGSTKTPGRCTRGRHPVFAPALADAGGHALMSVLSVQGTTSSKPCWPMQTLVLMAPSTIDC